MELANWTDADLTSVRDKLHLWCARRQAPTWANRFWGVAGYVGAFAFLTGLTDAFFGGITGLNVFLMLVGAATCFSWYKGDKQRKKNIDFLEKLDRELVRRGHKPSASQN
jgi:hypothetical protein